MRGKLSDKPFPRLLGDLSRENATGRLRLTQSGKIREILIESGVPVFASSSIPYEQPEHRLVEEGLIRPEQLEAAMRFSRQTSQPVEKILVQTKAITRLGLQRVLCELSTSIVNSASEWVTGEYTFVPGQKVPLEAKLIWTSTECILSGARHASSNNSVLDTIAPDDRIVKPASDPGDIVASSASLSSTEGYVLSCIQSPTAIGEASMLTGLSHMDTRRAIMVLMFLGLLEDPGSPARESEPDNQAPTNPASMPLSPASISPGSTNPPPISPAPISPTPINPPSINNASGKPGSSWESDAWPLEFESSAYGADDSRQQEFNSGDISISFVDYPEQIESRRVPDHPASSHASPESSNNGVSKDRQRPPLEERAAPAPTAAPPAAPVGGPAGSIFIPGTAAPPAQESGRPASVSTPPAAPARANAGSIFIPGAAAAIPHEAARPAHIPPPPATSTGAKTGSIFIPTRVRTSPLESGNTTPNAAPGAPVRERPGSVFIPGAAPPARESVSSAPIASPTRESASSAPIAAPPATPIRPNSGSIFIPGTAAPPAEGNAISAPISTTPAAPVVPGMTAPPGWEPANSAPIAAAPAAPTPEYPPPLTTPGDYAAAAIQERGSTGVRATPAADPAIGYGWNGEDDPRLHQEWRDQTAQLEQPARPDNDEDERFLKRVIEELGAKIKIAATADYYQILGVDKLASNGSITRAYERITRINDSHKSRWPYNGELQAQISSLMVVVNKAYETLGSPEKRRIYDMPPRQQAPPVEIERGSGVPTGSIRPNAVTPRPNAVTPDHPPAAPGASGALAPPAVERRNPYEAAEELYRRGRASFTRSDLQAAAHLLRQAVKLDPNRATYHYQLGMTLFILSQARSEHKHDKGCHVTCKMGGNLTRNQRIRHEAEQHLLKASELEPSNSDIKLKLALLYKDANMDRKAHQYFYEALMLDPDCHIARVELGMEDTRKKDEDQWIKDLMKDRMKKK